MCQHHYNRWYHHGDPLYQPAKKHQTNAEYNRRKYERHKEACDARSAKWAKENPERSREIKRKSAQRAEAKEKMVARVRNGLKKIQNGVREGQKSYSQT